MSATSLAPDRKAGNRAGTVAIVLGLWFAASAFAGYAGLLQNPPGQPPLPLVVATAVPVGLFLALYFSSAGFRGYVLGLDPRLVTVLQTWRILGLMFVGLYAFDVLPALFALPAGLGDAAIGIAAVPVMLALVDNPDFARTRAFKTFHVLGLFDFVVAFTAGTLAAGVVPGLVSGGLTSAPLTVLPLSLIPGFLVPLFTILHLTALLQARQLSRQADPIQ